LMSALDNFLSKKSSNDPTKCKDDYSYYSFILSQYPRIARSNHEEMEVRNEVYKFKKYNIKLL